MTNTPDLTVTQEALADLAARALPCPFCGEQLVVQSDHHGFWVAHKNEPGPCVMSIHQIFDESDLAEWNVRTILSRPEAQAGEVVAAARLLAEHAQANGYDRFRWGVTVQTEGEQAERYDVTVTGPDALAPRDGGEDEIERVIRGIEPILYPDHILTRERYEAVARAALATLDRGKAQVRDGVLEEAAQIADATQADEFQRSPFGSGLSQYGEGYEAAARDIAAAIRSRREGK